MIPTIPRCTYRLQFHKGFTFADARKIVPYLHTLGVSHLYASPIFRASPGSMHGYDVCDHNELNPELGTRKDFDNLLAEIKRHDMGLILDFVPNHMGIAEETNDWWMDVLEDGPNSPYAKFFDIDWNPIKTELRNRILLPILGDQYGRVLEKGDLKLDCEEGDFVLHYGERCLPVATHTTAPLLSRVVDLLRENGKPVPAELESLIFSQQQMPVGMGDEKARIAVLKREKGVFKERLKRLCKEQPAVDAGIKSVVETLNKGGTPEHVDELDRLINAQAYRLASWRVAGEEINYRRFFDINDLAALRMQDDDVFEATHKLALELLSGDVVTGLRIDHIDGLWDPVGYLKKLQQKYAALHGSNAADKPLYLLVEKILGHDEVLRADWPVHGTTGYEFGAQAGGVLVDSRAEERITKIYRRFTGNTTSYAECVYRGKLQVMRAAMASEVNMLASMLNRISETNRWYRDFTLSALTTAIREIIASFPVYRSYVTPEGEVGQDDRRVILRAIAIARRKNPALERTVFDFIRDVLLPPDDNAHPVDEQSRREFVLKLQQVTGPITAKGVEDTAFYVYTPLLALNEVGGHPGVFGTDVSSFHQSNSQRGGAFPDCMLGSSTHDTKRSEDVRARIAALSEMPRDWARAVIRWHRINRDHRKEIDGSPSPAPSEEYYIYQTLLGSWPLAPMSGAERKEYIRRIQETMIKALHEAKENSSWIEPNQEWDTAVCDFVAKILDGQKDNAFEAAFLPMAKRVAELGAINALSQTVLKLTSPGVPDIYQGQEVWDFSLVDPDNRRPVDYKTRGSLLSKVEKVRPAELMDKWQDGRLKLFITVRLLQLRTQHPDLFVEGDYHPIQATGTFASNCIAFRRTHGATTLYVVAPRLTSQVGSPPVGPCWQDTSLTEIANGELRNIFTNETIQCTSGLELQKALSTLPVGVFIHHGAS